MTEKEKFEQISGFIEILIEGRKTGKIKFKDLTQKENLGKIYQSIYHVNPVMSCDNCVRFYLDQLEAYHQREYPKYLKTLPEVKTESIAVNPALPDTLESNVNETSARKNKTVKPTKKAKPKKK